jgi:hypothetical protein
VDADIGTTFKVPAFEGCAFDRQFTEHSLSGVGRFTDVFLIMNMALAVGDPGFLSR